MVKMALKKRKLGLPENAKRPKAQRKFAQGQFFPTTSSYAYNCNTVTTPPTNNYNAEPPPEVFPTRPNTEDFLTYLCYRGTPSLPTNLEFVKTAQQKSKAEQKKNTSNSTTPSKSPGRKKNASPSKTAAEASTSTATPMKRKDTNTNNSERDDSPPIKAKRKDLHQDNISNIVKTAKGKKGETLSTGSSPKTVSKAGNKSSSNIRRSLRTRTNVNSLADIDDYKDYDDYDDEELNIEQDILSNEKCFKNEESKNSKISENIAVTEVINKTNEDQKINISSSNSIKDEFVKQEKHVGRPRKHPISPKTEKSLKKVEIDKNISAEKVSNELLISSENNSPSPSKIQRTKKPQKKSKLNTSNTLTTKNEAEKCKDEAVVTIDKVKDIDDIPLKSRIFKKDSPIKIEDDLVSAEKIKLKDNFEEKSTKIKCRKIQSRKLEGNEILIVNEEKIKSDVQKCVNKFGANEKKEKKTPGRKKKVKTEIADTNECKVEEKHETGRPQRKTKEAAAIYMELIGHKLNSDNYEEDDNSSQSFPDLPNVKETAKMEQEMKLNAKNQSTKNEKEKEKLATIMQEKNIVNSSNLEKQTIKAKGKIVSNAGANLEKKGVVKKQLKKGRKKKIVQKIKRHITGDTDKGSDDEIEENENINDPNQNTFSESDDEPLAVKICKASDISPQTLNKESPLPYNSVNNADNLRVAKISKEQLEKSTKNNSIENAKKQNNLLFEENHVKKPLLKTNTQFKMKTAEIKARQESNDFSGKFPSFCPKSNLSLAGLTQTGNTRPEAIETYPSAIVNPTFLTPKFEGNVEGKVPVSVEIIHKPIGFTSVKTGKGSPQENFVRNQDDIVPTNSQFGLKNSVSTTPTPIAFATNLMPSKEESGKIFGIASVSLAQSSGPDNTKCTLGKCGSIHKPTLGPVVPTESYLGEQLLSSKERRKAKVNMTHEQIHKWLIECSSNPDEIQDDLDDDFEDIYKLNSFSNPSPTLSKCEKEPTNSFNSKKEKDNSGGSTVKNESTWSGKGPSLKAVPVVVNDKDIIKSEDITLSENKKQNLFEISKSSENKNEEIDQQEKQIEEKELSKKPKLENSTKKPEGKGLKRKQEKNSTYKNKKQLNEKEKCKNIQEKNSSPETLKAVTKNENSTSLIATLNSSGISTSQLTYPTKKYSPIHSKLRQPAKDLDRLKIFSNTFTNSLENEKSVYTFDKDDDELPPIARTFRQPIQKGSETGLDHEKNEIKTDCKTTTSKNNDRTSVSGDNNKNNTINGNKNELVDEETCEIEKARNNKLSKTRRKSTMNEFILNDSEGETFYIPIQGAALTNSVGSNKSDLLQAVEVKVKVGREGPDGPNQRVSVQATLVTKTHLGRSSSPSLSASAINSAALVAETEDKKSLSKSAACQTAASKSVPIGTVTPRFKSEGSSLNNNGLKRVNSNSSLLSGSNKSRNNNKKASTSYTKKRKSNTPIKMYNNTAFPRRDDPAQMVEAPVFRPTDKEFHDPMEFIERITPIAARFGICKIIPPLSFKPECRVSDEMRFSAYNQYVHKMLYRWGPNVKELNAIKKHCQTQRVSLTPFPLIGQMQVDLPRLYHTVQELGGLQEVMEKKKWTRVADEMCIPKLAQDRATRLDDIYCKYLLPYDTLSSTERQKLFDEVESDWAKCEARARRTADFLVNSENNSFEENLNEPSEDSEEEADGVSMECIVRGKSMPLKQFVRIARNTSSLWFKNVEPTTAEVESEFWRHVAVRDSHVCVHSGSIDSSGWGYGFPSPGPKGKGSHCAKHPWNLKVLTNNPGSVLRSLGPVMGVTVPTLHVGMLFSACCWYRDPHGLSWIEYLHTGASKIWYGIPDDQSSNFRSALTTLIPSHCQNKTIWLPCDTVMVPPHMLTDRGVSLCRTEQKPGEFVVIFPRSYTSSISSGYVVSESVYFATATWLESAKDDFKDIHDSCEPALFSLEQLLFSIGSDQRVSKEVLEQCLPMLVEVFAKENESRNQIEASGVTTIEKISQEKGKNKKKVVNIEEENECDICRANLYISVVKSNDKNSTYCLEHALKYIRKGNLAADQCTLLYSYSIEEINDLIQKVRERLEQRKY